MKILCLLLIAVFITACSGNSALPDEARNVLRANIQDVFIDNLTIDLESNWQVASAQRAPNPENTTLSRGAADEVWCVTISPAAESRNGGATWRNFVIYRVGLSWTSESSYQRVRESSFLRVGCTNWAAEKRR